MSTIDPQASATRQDLQDLKQELFGQFTFMMEMIGQNKIETESKITDLYGHFDFTVEQITFELRGANKDEIAVINDRVTRLERHAGFPKR